MKFLIAGGGICGLTTAIALHQQGIEVAVYEAAETIKAVGAGLNLSSNAIQALVVIGLKDAVLAQSRVQNGGHLYTSAGKLLNYTDLSPLVKKFGVPGLISIHRVDLHQILYEAVKDNIQFYTNKKAQDVEQLENGVRIHFTDNTSAEGDYLLACDGIHSAIRKKLLPTIDPQHAGYTIWRGLFTDDSKQIPLEAPFKTWGKNGQFGAVPMIDNRTYWYASYKTKHKDPIQKEIRIVDLKKRFAEYHSPIPKMLELSEDKDLLSNDAEEIVDISNFAFGKILLMGDAAHAMTPNLGQGACQAIEDAVVLAKLLTSEASPEKAFLAYEQQRMPRTKRAALDSRKVGNAAHLDKSIPIALRNFYLSNMAKGAFKKQVEFLTAVQF